MLRFSPLQIVNRQIIAKRLRMQGHTVVLAEHGGIAIRKFEEDRNFGTLLLPLSLFFLPLLTIFWRRHCDDGSPDALR
jgi:hypothetical protein